MLDVAEDCRTALELGTDALETLDVTDTKARPSSASASLGTAQPIVMPA